MTEEIKIVDAPGATLKEIAKVLQELKALNGLGWEEYHARYNTPEEREAVIRWQVIDGKATHASEEAKKASPKSKPTVADGLPPAYVELLEKLQPAVAVHAEWEELFNTLTTMKTNPTYLGFQRGEWITHLAGEVAEAVRKPRSESFLVMQHYANLIEPKEREGTIARRVRSAFYSEQRNREKAAGQAAYEAVMNEMGGQEAEKAAEKARRAADKRHSEAVHEVGKRLQVLLQAYLLEVSRD